MLNLPPSLRLKYPELSEERALPGADRAADSNWPPHPFGVPAAGLPISPPLGIVIFFKIH
jgi:hypothetical protein